MFYPSLTWDRRTGEPPTSYGGLGTQVAETLKVRTNDLAIMEIDEAGESIFICVRTGVWTTQS